MTDLTPAATHGVRPELEHLLVAVGDLHNHPRNPRRGDVDLIAESLDRFGQMSAVLATADGTIVKGNHTYRAALKLGWTHIAAVRMEMTKDDADAYLVGDNRTGDVGTYDHAQLLDIVRDLDNRDLLRGVGYDTDSIAELAELVDALGELSAGEDSDDLDAPPPLDQDEDGVERGQYLAGLDTNIGDPETELSRGAIVRLGQHYLLVESVYAGHAEWGVLLAENPERLFIPYPMPTLPLTDRADQQPLVLVQPDVYLAGHLVDKWVSVRGRGDVEIIRRHR